MDRTDNEQKNVFILQILKQSTKLLKILAQFPELLKIYNGVMQVTQDWILVWKIYQENKETIWNEPDTFFNEIELEELVPEGFIVTHMTEYTAIWNLVSSLKNIERSDLPL
jgi:hypothetical protein